MMAPNVPQQASGLLNTLLPPKGPVEIFWEDAPSSRQALQPSGAPKANSKTLPDSPKNPSNRPGGAPTNTHYHDDMKDLWLNLVLDRLAPSTTAPKLHHVERNVAGYSPGEMQALCRRWQRAEQGWKMLGAPDSSLHIERPMDLELARGGCQFLLPGGRWLFSIGRSIVYHNLDLPVPAEQHLVDLLPPEFVSESTPVRVSQPELDAKSATLVFNIAVVLPSPGATLSSHPTSSPAEPRSVVQIWRIRLRTSPPGAARFSMLGPAGEFVSQQLASFPYTRSTVGIRCVSLSGANVALSGREDREGERYTDVIDWVAATGDSLLFPRRMLRTCYDHIFLLPSTESDTSSSQSHLFAYNRHTLALFEHTLIKPTSSPTAPRLPAKHAVAWHASIEKGEKPSACSQPYVCKGTVRFVVYSSGTIYGVVISTSSTSDNKSVSERGKSPSLKSNSSTATPFPARLVTLAHLPSLGVAVSPLAVPTLGYKHAIFSAAAVTQDQSLVVVTYDWPEGDLPSPEGPFNTRPAQAQARILRVRDLGAKGARLPDSDGLLMDEGTGRMVLMPQFGMDTEQAGPVVVIDLGGEDGGNRSSVLY